MKTAKLRSQLMVAAAMSAALCIPGINWAQATLVPMPPLAEATDENSIDMATAFTKSSLPSISIGSGASLLQRSVQYNYSIEDYHAGAGGEIIDNFGGNIMMDNWTGRIMYSYLGKSEFFRNGSVNDPTRDCNPVYAGRLLSNFSNEFQINAPSGGYCRFSDSKISYEHDSAHTFSPSDSDQVYKITAHNGDIITYQDLGYQNLMVFGGAISSIEQPSGEILKIYYRNQRKSAVASNYGYMLKFEYSSPGPGQTATVKAINLAVDYCDPMAATCATGSSWPAWIYSATGGQFNVPNYEGDYDHPGRVDDIAVTDPLNGTYHVGITGRQFPSGRTESVNYPSSVIFHETFFQNLPGPSFGGVAYDDFYRPAYVQRDGYPIPNGVCSAFDAKICINGIFTTTNSNGTTTYNFESRDWSYDDTNSNPRIYAAGRNQNATMTVTNGVGATRTVKSQSINGTRLITSMTDELGRETKYEYTYMGSEPKLTKVTYPEGNVSTLSYDWRENLKERRDKPKSGWSLADKVWVAHYEDVCVNIVTCNLPNYTIDPNGNQTDYVYDPVHGGPLKVTTPPDANGVRAQTRSGYTQLYAKAKNSNGTLVNASTPIWKLTCTVTVPSTAGYDPTNPCAAAAQYQVTTFAYDNNNLLMTSTTVKSGDGAMSMTTDYGYDDIGNRIWTDGPLPGDNDRTYTVYDILRRPTFEIGGRGDSGATRQIVKHVYDVDSREKCTELGTGYLTNGSDFQPVSYTQKIFDSTTGLPVKTITAEVQGGTAACEAQ